MDAAMMTPVRSPGSATTRIEPIVVAMHGHSRLVHPGEEPCESLATRGHLVLLLSLVLPVVRGDGQCLVGRRSPNGRSHGRGRSGW